MTETNLKSALADEMQDVDPMTTVVPQVLAEGRRRERRRRASVGLAAAAALGIVAVAATTLGGDRATSERSPAADDSADEPVTQTKAEFAAWSADKFDEVLPDEFSDVRTTEHNDYVTYVGGTRMEFNLNITYVDWEHSDFKPGQIDLSPSCDGIGGDSCTALPSLDAIANHDTTDDDSPYAGMEMYVGERSAAADDVTLNFFGKPGEGPVPLTDDEILDLAASPEFETIWRECAAHPKWIYSSTHVKLKPAKGADLTVG